MKGKHSVGQPQFTSESARATLRKAKKGLTALTNHANTMGATLALWSDNVVRYMIISSMPVPCVRVGFDVSLRCFSASFWYPTVMSLVCCAAAFLSFYNLSTSESN